ncbi:P-loop containing nucleoside triphosphate hydrolase protein [Mycena leptocephala]|nr:P-loop containing nucleoside triphosphate hydrolase protein [Mycena leptocephala]
MPFTPLVDLDPIKVENASRNLCTLFSVPSLRPYQVETGQNTLKGISTFLGVPTGGGKTLAFWYSLFYHWAPGNTDPDCQKIILGVGPLTALLESQAADLAEKGVPAVAISSTSEERGQILAPFWQDVAQNKYRVALISPEMGVSDKFHQTVLSSDVFTDNVISLLIDEAHCINEWGNDDIRREYSKLAVLVARLPSGVPVVAGSATMPKHVISLSVRIIQHPLDTLADLITLFPREAPSPQDFVQTLIYAEDRVKTEKIQDFCRSNCPETIPADAFEFYHRHIDEARRKVIQERIQNGELRGIVATDALGMEINFMLVLQVILWLCPKPFLSLVQKIGRCARAAELLGEVILYITNAAYMQYKIELDILKGDLSDDGDDEEASEQLEGAVEGEQMDRDAAIEQEEPEQDKAPKPKAKKAMTILEARDRRYLLEYIVTTGCRCILWNKFFGNNSKRRVFLFTVKSESTPFECSITLFAIQALLTRLFIGSALRITPMESSSGTPSRGPHLEWSPVTPIVVPQMEYSLLERHSYRHPSAVNASSRRVAKFRQ